jgi:hypothetical protein
MDLVYTPPRMVRYDAVIRSPAQMATKTSPQDEPGGDARTVKEVELLRVLISRAGRQVSAQWALHPQIKQDLKAEEIKEVTELMSQVTGIVGKRFAEILAAAEPDQPGTA